MKVQVFFLSLIILSSFISISAHARDWDQCRGTLRSTGARVSFTSNFSDGEPQTIEVSVYSRPAISDFDEYVSVTQQDTSTTRSYVGSSHFGRFVLAIQARSCTSGPAPLHCSGVAQFDALDGGAAIPVTCNVNIPYTPASGSHCSPGIPCH